MDKVISVGRKKGRGLNSPQSLCQKVTSTPGIDLVLPKTYILIPYLQPKYGLKKVISVGKNEGVASEGQTFFILDKN